MNLQEWSCFAVSVPAGIHSEWGKVWVWVWQQLLLQGYCTVQYEGRPTRARIEKEWLMVCGVQQDRATSGASATQPGLIKRGDC